MSSFNIERIITIRRLIQERPVFTRAELNAWLKKHRMKFCDKTINRDIEFLRDRLGYTLEFDWRVNKWHAAAPKERVL